MGQTPKGPAAIICDVSCLWITKTGRCEYSQGSLRVMITRRTFCDTALTLLELYLSSIPHPTAVTPAMYTSRRNTGPSCQSHLRAVQVRPDGVAELASEDVVAPPVEPRRHHAADSCSRRWRKRPIITQAASATGSLLWHLGAICMRGHMQVVLMIRLEGAEEWRMGDGNRGAHNDAEKDGRHGSSHRRYDSLRSAGAEEAGLLDDGSLRRWYPLEGRGGSGNTMTPAQSTHLDNNDGGR